MRQPITNWQVTSDATNGQAAPILAQDRVWNSFALADLEAPLRAYSQFAIASQDGSNDRAACLILRHPIIGEVLSPFGAEGGIAAILNQLTLPERPSIQVQEKHIRLLQSYYRPETSWRKMFRMAITSASWRPQAYQTPSSIHRLTDADLPALKNLYDLQPEIAFSADLFPQGLYFGAYAGEQIVAAGGTHVLVPAYGVAVLGHILTASQARGKGYATAITAALVTTLLKQNFSTVVLNVFTDNIPAIRVYQRLGFQTHHNLFAGKAYLIPQV